ncbi:MAG TPA: signal recognition particle-docking protein FtsY [Kiritimatiellia bacterium]|nr:signal recognition particle-docking protein FtsY [Kiritimatiellia bacterium]HRZ12912.1 signal recognition particle-docking protein FtsY [Kiritimatiellia bacterium]HSA18478.1 signal recognition particle-docking protein FtsY [Kiritimatiellia bacterium]
MVTWIDALARTRRQIAGVLSRVFSGRKKEDVSFEELEETLLLADVPVQLATKLVAEMEQAYAGLRVSRREMLRQILRDSLKGVGEGPFSWPPQPRPLVILVVGVNGSGKTTTSAKLARRALEAGLNPLLGAADTFRAAGVDQLKWWADHLDVESVAGAPNADAAAVAYDALDAAIARKKDALIVDTAGRMHTKQPLMQELQKVRGALNKRLPGAPHETWIVLDATLGQNALAQARVFHEAVPLTGAIVAKLDGSAKAGFVFGVTRDLGIPIRFAGLGESADSLAPFDPDEFVDALLGKEAETEPAGT